LRQNAPQALQEGSLDDLEHKILERLTPEQGRRLAAGEDPKSIVLDSGETLAQFIDEALEKGTTPQGLSYFPIDLCILMRTGASSRGKMVADETRILTARGETTNLTAQGGSSTGCGIPNEAQAILVNFIVLFPEGSGGLKYYPSHVGGSPGTLIRYTNSSEGIQFDNAVITELCDPAFGCTPGDDLRVQALDAGTHLRIDVMGYFATSAAGDLDCVGCVDGTEIAAGTVSSSNINSSQVQTRVTEVCPAGSSIRAISEDGTVTCDAGGTGGGGGGLPNWQRISFDFSCTANSICYVTVGCPAGNVLGGGLDLLTASVTERVNILVNRTFPITDIQWQVEASNYNGTAVTYRAWATCAQASEGAINGEGTLSGAGVLGKLPPR
jgi:hypothetical protein